MDKREKYMERIFLVQNFDLKEVNKFLREKNARVKFIQAVTEAVTGGDDYSFRGDVFAYVVVEYETIDSQQES